MYARFALSWLAMGFAMLVSFPATADLAGKITNEVVSKDKPQADPNTNQKGREYKAENAKKQSNVGKSVATATGVSLTARAIPMLASPILSVRIAGAELMAKAGLEFGQAGADAGTAEKNGNQEKTLKQNAGQSGSQLKDAYTKKPEQPKIDSPELDAFLGERGINSDDFKEQLSSGKLTDAESVMKAIGETAEVTDEDRVSATSLADTEVALAISSVHDPKTTATLVNDDSHSKNEGALSGSGSSASGSSTPTTESTGTPSPELSHATVMEMNIQGMLPTNLGKLNDPLSAIEKSPDFNALLLSLFGSTLGIPSDKLAYILGQRLQELGILRTNRVKNIFWVAHRFYGNYSKWRKSTWVAQSSYSDP